MIVLRRAGWALLLLGAYAWLVRPKLLRWGATDEELHERFPGVDLIPGAIRVATMAITIDAPPSRVWPWLVQMGYGRAGFYSWDALDNFGRPSSNEIHPEWQSLAVGDRIKAMGADAFAVALLEPERFLGLRPVPGYGADALWGFLLREFPGGKTRLVVSGYWTMRPRLLRPLVGFALFEWTHWIMQTRQLEEVKKRAEAASGAPAAD